MFPAAHLPPRQTGGIFGGHSFEITYSYFEHLRRLLFPSASQAAFLQSSRQLPRILSSSSSPRISCSPAVRSGGQAFGEECQSPCSAGQDGLPACGAAEYLGVEGVEGRDRRHQRCRVESPSLTARREEEWPRNRAKGEDWYLRAKATPPLLSQSCITPLSLALNTLTLNPSHLSAQPQAVAIGNPAGATGVAKPC